MSRLAQIGIGIALPFFLIIAAIRILTSPQYISFEYNKAGFPPDVYGFSLEERRDFAISSLQFVRAPLPIEYLGDQTYAGQPLYNDRELGHMVDVQKVFQGAWRGWILAALILTASLISLLGKPSSRIRLLRAVEIGGTVTVLAIFSIGVLAVIGWNSWFTAFHQLFFQPGSWLFSPADTLIRLFPIKFWFDSVITVSAITLIGGLISAYLGFRLRINLAARLSE